MQNLGSNVNRLALLFGYRPRDVEVSSEISTEFLLVSGGDSIGHIHSATLCSIECMLNSNGFEIVKVVSCSPHYNKSNLLRVLDKLFSFSPTLTRRDIILASRL